MHRSIDPAAILSYLPILLKFLPLTMVILSGSLMVGSIVGGILAVARSSESKVVSTLAAAFVSFFRGTPVIIQLLLIFYGLPELVRVFGFNFRGVAPLFFVILTLGVHSSAALAESFRSAIDSVERGQVEAAYSVGLSGAQTLYRIVAPQALRVLMPNFANTVMSSLKDTSLAFSIGVVDMVGRGLTIGNVEFKLLEVYLALGIIYYLVGLLVGRLFQYWEQRLALPDQAFAAK